MCVLHIWIPQTLRRAGFIVEVSSLLSVTLKCFYTFKTSTSLSSWKKEILSKISDSCCQKLFVHFWLEIHGTFDAGGISQGIS